MRGRPAEAEGPVRRPALTCTSSVGLGRFELPRPSPHRQQQPGRRQWLGRFRAHLRHLRQRGRHFATPAGGKDGQPGLDRSGRPARGDEVKVLAHGTGKWPPRHCSPAMVRRCGFAGVAGACRRRSGHPRRCGRSPSTCPKLAVPFLHCRRDREPWTTRISLSRGSARPGRTPRRAGPSFRMPGRGG